MGFFWALICMQPDCLNLNCSECCKRYRIPLLPASEAGAIAKRLGIEENVFIRRHCVAVAALYACSEKKDGLSLNSETLPKKAVLFAVQELGFLPQRFLVLPYLALKRKRGGECVFLKNGKCEIHGFAPRACALFPAISLDSRPLKEHYPFCAAMRQKGFETRSGGLDKKQLAKTKAYFGAIEKRGFLAQCPVLPKEFFLLLEGKKELPITKKEFLQAIGPII
jgi:Fe-S-cluster containining protein